MPVEYKVNQRKTRAAQRNLRKLQKQIPNLTVPHKRIAVFLLKWVLTNFKQEGKPIGGWTPFALGGRRTSGGIDTTAKLLQDTGLLRNSFSTFHSRRDAGVGSNLSYAEDHNEGDPSSNLPARRMVPIQSEVVRDVNKIYRDYLRTIIRNNS